jgi:hypothetical protein
MTAGVAAVCDPESGAAKELAALLEVGGLAQRPPPLPECGHRGRFTLQTCHMLITTRARVLA